MRRILLFAALTAGAISGVSLVKTVESVLVETDPRAELPPCFEVGAPFHHRFRPNCVGQMKTPDGPKRLSVNEDGLRELARPRVLESPRRVLVLGDSFVEGWWATQEEALSSLLSEKFPGTYFINGGLRSTGPVMQAKRLRELLPAYRPHGLLWIVNDTDGLDDRFACAISSGDQQLSAPEFELSKWQRRATSLLGDTKAGNRLRRRFYQEKWLALATGEAATRCDPCRGARELKRLADEAGIPLLAFYLHTGDELPHAHYAGGSALREELHACLLNAGITPGAAGLRGLSKQEVERYVWEGDFHLNPQGTAMLVSQLAPSVELWLKKIGDTRGKRRAR